METNITDQHKLDSISDDEFAFGGFFVIANRLQTLLDREFEPYGMTAKQWFLSIIIGGVFDEPPTLGEAAAVMGSTHQNVKQVALKLKEKGFLEIADDEKDGRAVRLALTDKSREFWAGLQQSSKRFMGDVYEGLSAEDMRGLRSALGRVMANIEEMTNKKQ